jgi:hypothetical protein
MLLCIVTFSFFSSSSGKEKKKNSCPKMLVYLVNDYYNSWEWERVMQVRVLFWTSPCLLVSCVGLLITRLFGLPEFSPYLDVPFVKILLVKNMFAVVMLFNVGFEFGKRWVHVPLEQWTLKIINASGDNEMITDSTNVKPDSEMDSKMIQKVQ